MLDKIKKLVENFSPSILFATKDEEIERLLELYELDLIDSEPEEEFERITKLVSSIFNMPVVLISLITEDRQWFKSCIGIDVRETEREYAFCQHVIATKKFMVVEDTLKDERFVHNPLVKRFNIRFYAGAPLLTSKGNILGTLCLIDEKRRNFTEEDMNKLQAFADIVVGEIETRHKLKVNDELQEKLLEVTQKYSNVINYVNDIVFQTDVKGRFMFLSPSWEKITGYTIKEALNIPFSHYVEDKERDAVEVLYTALLNNRVDKFKQLIKFMTKDKLIKYLRISASLTLNDKGELLGMSGTFSDVTEVVELEKEKEQDLQIAREVQSSVLSIPIEDKHIKIDSEYYPTLDLSGDMYFWLKIDENKYGVILLDVMGHGVSSALINMSIRSTLPGVISSLQDPIKVFEELNRQMEHLVNNQLKITSYYTAIYMLIDTEKKTIEYVNAGHPNGVVIVDKDQVHELDKGSVPIGLFSNPTVEKGIITYLNEASVVLYTDGIIEVCPTRAYKEFILSCMRGFDKKVSSSSAASIVGTLQLPEKLPDDICVVSIELK